MSSSTRKKKTILFLAANPKNSTQLRLDQEVKEIDAGLQRAQKREKFQLEKMSAITPRDLQGASNLDNSISPGAGVTAYPSAVRLTLNPLKQG